MDKFNQAWLVIKLELTRHQKIYMVNNRLSTGIAGLDEILMGGLIPGQAYLVRGGPGCGKTTLGMHFLVAGHHRGEVSLMITLGESENQLRRNASALGLSLDQIAILDLSPGSDFFTQMQSYDIFSPAEVERDPITQKIIEKIESIHPQRVFVDSITQFRYLSSDPFQFRKQIVSFLRFLQEQGATIVFITEASPEAPDNDLQFIADGVITLEFVDEERTLSISKFRSSDFRKGTHTMRLTCQGMEVFPSIIPEEFKREFAPETISSGIPDLDELLQGGIERGTITIISGPSGVGKTTLGIQFMKEAAGRGERSLVCCFEEAQETLINRCESINIPVSRMLKQGTLSIIPIEPLIYTPNEFANLVRSEVEKHSAQIVMIDSIAGYRLSFKGANLVTHIHALCRYLKNMGVTVLLVNEVEAITGDFRVTELGISYLADNIIFLRYLEIRGELRKAIGVLKKRLTDFEKNLRELTITRYGIKVGKPLTNLSGILTGTPQFLKDE
ncbi:ATPase domain-containing protein [Gloeothece verrucosa]|uniref:non-specific serine/threonine protein kinase n=1 Tax=Gloeothece verrucosa (strain PCC 7822) TaxID=497965 RepID=E0UGE1_GLOV7|nr:ATPase domain-containing protein [Gloeothece verrucosa]ADN16760.1 putative circadian clock protein, KaiC [Gloeothece verrucosa PCC 7822]